MFSGIISEVGTCVKRSATELEVACSPECAAELTIGASVAVNGACLTVTELNEAGFTADVMPETWRRTALGTLRPGQLLNLELPLRLGGRLDGHLVQGHIDGTGTVRSLKRQGNSRLVTIEAGPALLQAMVEKGSVAVNGVSLTVIAVDEAGFRVGIIPHTEQQTMFRELKVGDAVNIETDLMAKYFLKFFREGVHEQA